MTSPPFESWIVPSLRGDSAAFSSLVRSCYGLVLAQCRAQLRNEADAEDATQETFVRAQQALAEERLRDPTQFAPYLRGIARHTCLDTIRRNSRRPHNAAHETDQADPHPGPEGMAEQNEEHRHLMYTIDSLPDTCREVLFLHYFNEMTYDQMAEWLGVARATVNERLRKGRQLLRQRLSQLLS